MADPHIRLVNVAGNNNKKAFQPELIYTRAFRGKFRNLRLLGSGFLFALYFGTVWLLWRSKPLILFNVAEQKFHIFDATFYPQDFVLLTWLLIICAFGLFFITVLFGRIWCGYTCPQSVFTWAFMRIEHWVEGDRNSRIRADSISRDLNYYVKKIIKHFLWLFLAIVTAITFVGYFVPIRTLLSHLVELSLEGWPSFWLVFFTLATYANAGWLREKVCTFMCPYARFQSVMFDSDTLTVAYDANRGEPRSHRKKQKEGEYSAVKEQGDCIECTLCVQVCPTGIDIRDGLQYECIGCAACVDACNAVMDKIGQEKNLISYTTENRQKGRKTSWFRPRLIGYFFAAVCATGAFFWMLSHRSLVDFDVTRDRSVMYRTLSSGEVENVYLLRIFNKRSVDDTFSVHVSGLPGLKYELPAGVFVSAGESVDLPVHLSVFPESLQTKAGVSIIFSVIPGSDALSPVTKKSMFFAPVK